MPRGRASGTRKRFERVRAVSLGLFFIVVSTSCAGAPDPHELARTDDRADGTALYTWLVDHEPSAAIAWNVPADRLRGLIPHAHIEAAASDAPCEQTARAHAALVLLLPRDGDRRLRDRALDCGIALYRDARGLVIAPR